MVSSVSRLYLKQLRKFGLILGSVNGHLGCGMRVPAAGTGAGPARKLFFVHGPMDKRRNLIFPIISAHFRSIPLTLVLGPKSHGWRWGAAAVGVSRPVPTYNEAGLTGMGPGVGGSPRRAQLCYYRTIVWGVVKGGMTVGGVGPGYESSCFRRNDGGEAGMTGAGCGGLFSWKGRGEDGAEDGIRTHDPLLGKEMLYH